jgi:cytochrome P450
MENPDEWRQVEADPGLVRPLIEEALRYDAPIQGFFRNTLADVEVAGSTIPANSKVMMLYGSANRDERQFPEPEAFRVRRNPEEHLAFGSGPHVCLGAHLARLEAEVLTRVFLERVRTMRREGPGERTSNPLLRGMAKLPVSLTAR